jgi:hypothetical protein
MKTITKLLLIAFLFSAAQLSFGQGCEEPAGDDDAAKLFGFFQPEFDYRMTDPGHSTFKFKRARIGFTGNIPYDFSYYVVMENSKFVSGTGHPYLLDAFISYKRFDWAKVSMGSFKQPFGQEVNTSCSGLHTIFRASVSDQLVAPQRDMGIMVTGGNKETFLKYAVAIMNGRGLLIEDNNMKKDFIARLTLKPLDFLRIGGSYRLGYPVKNEDRRFSFAGEMQIELADLLFQAEYIYDEGDYYPAAGGGCGVDPVPLGRKRDGYYAQVLYMTPWNLQPVVKFEAFDYDKNAKNTEETIITTGINYWFNDWTRIQVNYRYRAEKGAEVMNDDILVQLQVKF